jgi:predicted AlkP superfamily pyrophosphatase or phosphodiesterase
MLPRRRFLAVFAFLILAPAELYAAEPARPKLAVMVVLDQFRADYLSRWDVLYGEDGFRRLEKEGAWFQNCHYPYALTVTAAGHASLATGCSPDVHGIVHNEWFDRTSGEVIESVENNRYERVPAWPKDPPKDNDKETIKKKSRYGVSPQRLLAPTLADALKEATAAKSKVVSLSLKDRAAVMPGGLKPDACYWFDPDGGLFVTSTYYRDRVHDWVDTFNKEKPADRWFGKDWTKSNSDLDYERHSGPDDVDGEGKGYSQGRTFPHPLTGGLKQPGKAYYQAVYTSPFGNELLLELAERAIEAEKLGMRDAPDLLCLSFSANDAIGHVWGPDSQEVLDVTLRTDVLLGNLLGFLDDKVGKGKYVMVVTADHGVCPLPEVTRSHGTDAGRIDVSLLNQKASAFLDDKYGELEGKDRWFETGGVVRGYLNRSVIEKRGLREEDVFDALAQWLEKQPGIQKAYTRFELAKKADKDDLLGASMRRSYFADRSADVLIVPKPYFVYFDKLVGTNHATPHEYDTHVPLLVFGPGVNAGVYKEPITPLAVPVILAKLLGIKPPAKAEVEAPDKLFGPVTP